MNKICTDVKQSKKLIELGIDEYSADMYWDYDVQKHEEYSMVMDEQFDDTCIPAWSLVALMELMNRNCYNVSLNCHGAEWNVKFDDSEKYKDFTKDYAVDAAFEMVVWLLENKKI